MNLKNRSKLNQLMPQAQQHNTTIKQTVRSELDDALDGGAVKKCKKPSSKVMTPP
jgi:hypothetical protein